VKCYNDTFDLSCLTDGIVEYRDTNGDTRYTAGSATGTINIYPDSEVKITKASGIHLTNDSSTGANMYFSFIKAEGMQITLYANNTSNTTFEYELKNCIIGNWYMYSVSSPSAKLINCQSSVSNNAINGTGSFNKLEINNTDFNSIFFNNYEGQLKLLHLQNIPSLTSLRIKGYKWGDNGVVIHPLNDIVLQNCPNLTEIEINGFADQETLISLINQLPTIQSGTILLGYAGSRSNWWGGMNRALLSEIYIDQAQTITATAVIESKGWTIIDA